MRELELCRRCSNCYVKSANGCTVETYSCALVDQQGAWKVFVDRHSFQELDYPMDNCFDKDLS